MSCKHPATYDNGQCSECGKKVSLGLLKVSNELAERSKLDNAVIVGSEIRAAIGELEKEIEFHKKDAEMWRALMACDRIKVHGSAGVGECSRVPKESNYAHISIDFFTNMVRTC